MTIYAVTITWNGTKQVIPFFTNTEAQLCAASYESLGYEVVISTLTVDDIVSEVEEKELDF